MSSNSNNQDDVVLSQEEWKEKAYQEAAQTVKEIYFRLNFLRDEIEKNINDAKVAAVKDSQSEIKRAAWMDIRDKINEIYNASAIDEIFDGSKLEQTNLFNKSSTTYPPELDIALQAWQAVSTSEGKGKPKARIKKWLDDNFMRTELSDAAKIRISVVANWDKRGGATKTP